jgi:hypothetical protein
MENTIASAKAKLIIDNLINGNLTDAKDKAKWFPATHLIDYAMGIGYNYNESLLMATFLKGLIDYQYYCDNMNNR